MSFQDFQQSRGRFSPNEIRSLIVVILGVCLVLGVLVIGNYYLTGSTPGGGEFYLLRTASRSFLFDRIEPYSANVPSAVQTKVYGRLARPGEKPYILDLPFHLMPAFFPLALFPRDEVARAFWLGLLEIGLVVFLITSLRLVMERVPVVPGALVVILCCGSYYAYLSLLEGTEVILLGLAYTGTLLALRYQRDSLAGMLLVISAFHWQVGAPFLFFIAISIYWAKRWRVYMGAAMALFILAILSFLMYPGWILPFMRASWNNLQLGFGISTRIIFNSMSLQYGDFATWGLAALVVIVMGYEWNASRDADFQQVIWTACLTIAMTPLLGFRSEIVNLVVLLFPVVVILMMVRERWKSLGTGLMVILLVIVIGLPWLVVGGFISIPNDAIQEFLFLFLPASTILGLFWIRWWMIRLPRTWMDQVSLQR